MASTASAHLLDAGWIAAHLLFGAAALHPSMTTVSQPAEPKLTLTPGRMLAIAAAALIAPDRPGGQAPARGGSGDTVVAGGAAIVLFALVDRADDRPRRAQEAAGERERTMRLAAEALVAATSPAEIIRAALDAAARARRCRRPAGVLQIEQREHERWLVGADPRGGAERTPSSRFRCCPRRRGSSSNRRVGVDLRSAEAATCGLGLDATAVFAAPILVQGQLAGVVALLDAAGSSNATRNSLETLAAQVGLALESAALTEQVLRTRARRVSAHWCSTRPM